MAARILIVVQFTIALGMEADVVRGF